MTGRTADADAAIDAGLDASLFADADRDAALDREDAREAPTDALVLDSSHSADAGADAGDALEPCETDGAVRCGSQCNTATSGTAEACGATCARCPSVENATAECQQGVCALRCLPTYELVGGRCLPLAPAAVEPLSTWTHNGQEVTFVTTTHPDFVRYEHRLCSERPCITGGITSWTTTAATSRAPMPIAPHHVHYWRVTGVLRDGTERAREAIPFRTTRRATRGYDTPFFDFDGDGYADMLASFGFDPEVIDRTFAVPTVLFGGSDLASEGRRQLLDMTPRNPSHGLEHVRPIGDFNGDGFPDVLMSTDRKSMQVAFGGPGRSTVRWSTPWTISEFTVWFSSNDPNPGSPTERGVHRGVVALGDVTGDGLTDFAMLSTSLRPNPHSGIRVFAGNREGRLVESALHTQQYLLQIVRSSRCPAPGGQHSQVVLVQYGLTAVSPYEYRIMGFDIQGTSIRQLPDSPIVAMNGPLLDDVGDIDGDGQPETLIRAAVTHPDALLARVVCGRPGEHRLTVQRITVPPLLVSVARASDLDGDGNHELIFNTVPSAESPEYLRVYRLPSLPTFGTPTRTLTQSTPHSRAAIAAFDVGYDHAPHVLMTFGSPGDMNGDGADDLPVSVRFPAVTLSLFNAFTSSVQVHSGNVDPARWFELTTRFTSVPSLYHRLIL